MKTFSFSRCALLLVSETPDRSWECVALVLVLYDHVVGVAVPLVRQRWSWRYTLQGTLTNAVICVYCIKTVFPEMLEKKGVSTENGTTIYRLKGFGKISF